MTTPHPVENLVDYGPAIDAAIAKARTLNISPASVDDPELIARLIAAEVLRVATPQIAEPYEDLLGAIWLYIDWRYVTKQLTTPQKELFADAVDRDVMRSQAEDGEEPRPVTERWWRDA